jgi:hypothetical protein
VSVDVLTEIEIELPRRDVAPYASDPDNATSWYENIKSVDWKTPGPLAVGADLSFGAEFLGRRLTYTYRIEEFVPGERLVMHTADGPFPEARERVDVRSCAPASNLLRCLRSRSWPAEPPKLFSHSM